MVDGFLTGGAAGLMNLVGGGLQAGMSWAQMKAQMNFQERMFKNRHTYAVEDLRRAGLNPILSAQYGAGSSPPGASATFQNPAAGAVSAAAQARLVNQQAQLLREKSENTAADTVLKAFLGLEAHSNMIKNMNSASREAALTRGINWDNIGKQYAAELYERDPLWRQLGAARSQLGNLGPLLYLLQQNLSGSGPGNLPGDQPRYRKWIDDYRSGNVFRKVEQFKSWFRPGDE